MSTALVSIFDDMAVVHEPECDKVRVLSKSVVTVLDYLNRGNKAEDQMLELIGKYCLSLSVHEKNQDESKAYLQHLIEQGIIKKLHDSL
ncbi:hypothetical protein [Neptunomonas qingdaonensis]|nr:hypothetical protein [Neptunomonas qingdaonensis]